MSPAFVPTRPRSHSHHAVLASASPSSEGFNAINFGLDSSITSQNRRSLVIGPIIASVGITCSTIVDSASAADGNLNQIVAQLKESSKMMEDIPELIKAEKWDAGEYFVYYIRSHMQI